MAMTSANNLFSDIPPEFKEELFETILKRETFRIERIVSHGHSSPEGFWYDQDENEWVVLLQGMAGIEFPDGSTSELSKGEYIFLEAHRKHRVSFTSSDPACIWLAVFWK